MSMGPPIILVGTQRSGTSWLSRVLATHPRLALAVEPRHIWSWGNSYRPDDVLTAHDARPEVVRYIRRTFEQFVADQGKDRLLEKTPSNCLRLPFVHAVFPEARIILVLRDGRQVISSTEQIMARGPNVSRVLERVRHTPLRDWPAYLIRDGEAIVRKLTRRPLRFWGPRPPGWRRWLRHDPPRVVLARQWAETLLRAYRDAQAIGPDHVLIYRYEDLVARPRETMARLVAFAGLDHADLLLAEAERTADPARATTWPRRLDPATLELVRPIIEPALAELGYTW